MSLYFLGQDETCSSGLCECSSTACDGCSTERKIFDLIMMNQKL
jgi:hypothetical protein